MSKLNQDLSFNGRVEVKLWNRLKRKRDGWVERKRRFQKMFAEKMQEAAGQKVLVMAGEKLPDKGVAR